MHALDKYLKYPVVHFPYNTRCKESLKLYCLASNQPDVRLFEDKRIIDEIKSQDLFKLSYLVDASDIYHKNGHEATFEASPWDVAGLFGAGKVIEWLAENREFKSNLNHADFFKLGTNIGWDKVKVQALSQYFAEDAKFSAQPKVKYIPLEFPNFKDVVLGTSALYPDAFKQPVCNYRIPPMSVRSPTLATDSKGEVSLQDACENWLTLQSCYGSNIFAMALLGLQRFDILGKIDLHPIGAMVIDAELDISEVEAKYLNGVNGAKLYPPLVDAITMVRELRTAQAATKSTNFGLKELEAGIDLG